MITKNPEQIKILHEGGAILARVLRTVAAAVKPEVSAYDLNLLAEEEIKKFQAKPSFKNYKSHPDDSPFPAALCVSVNDEIVHGIPDKKKILHEGDIVGLDLGVWYKELCTDGAITVPVGKIKPAQERLLKATKQSLKAALDQVKAGMRTGDLGHAMQTVAEKAGFQVVRELVGHGVGKAVHEDPEVPGYGKPGTGIALVEGMVIAIEPMLNAGHWKIRLAPDGWTIKTYDGSLSAHFEHTVLVTINGCEVLTTL